jgi:hypothetical protein
MNEWMRSFIALQPGRGAEDRVEYEPAQGRDAMSRIAQPNNRRLWQHEVLEMETRLG